MTANADTQTLAQSIPDLAAQWKADGDARVAAAIAQTQAQAKIDQDAAVKAAVADALAQAAQDHADDLALLQKALAAAAPASAGASPASGNAPTGETADADQSHALNSSAEQSDNAEPDEKTAVVGD